MNLQLCRSARCAALVFAIAGLSACNLLSGADDLALGNAGGGGEGEETIAASTSVGQGGASAASASATSGSAGGSTPMGECNPPCGANAYCEAATDTCVCSPGFVMQSGACSPAPVGDPTTHTQQEVCDQWNAGHVVTDPSPLVASGAECDPGSLKQAGITDTLTRINMFRWMSGLGPTVDDSALNDKAQKCANLESWWDWSSGLSPHSPPSNAKCYSAEGAQTAGESNLAWGSGHPAQAIDQYMEDNGNETTMGHRRWILNPPLSPVGIGYWQTGGQYGNAQCLRVFGSQGNGPTPPWVSLPPAGYVPLVVAGWTWTFHGSLGGIASAQISVLRVSDNAPLNVAIQTLQQGYAEDAISWNPSGWTPAAGETYRVTVAGLSGGDVVYDVKPVNCN